MNISDPFSGVHGHRQAEPNYITSLIVAHSNMLPVKPALLSNNVLRTKCELTIAKGNILDATVNEWKCAWHAFLYGVDLEGYSFMPRSFRRRK